MDKSTFEKYMAEIKKFTTIAQKRNLNRLMKE